MVPRADEVAGAGPATPRSKIEETRTINGTLDLARTTSAPFSLENKPFKEGLYTSGGANEKREGKTTQERVKPSSFYEDPAHPPDG
jgi:hypothetical protein